MAVSPGKNETCGLWDAQCKKYGISARWVNIDRQKLKDCRLDRKAESAIPSTSDKDGQQATDKEASVHESRREEDGEQYRRIDQHWDRPRATGLVLESMHAERSVQSRRRAE